MRIEIYSDIWKWKVVEIQTVLVTGHNPMSIAIPCQV